MVLDFSGTFTGECFRARQKEIGKYPIFDFEKKHWKFTKAEGNFYVKQTIGESEYEIAQVEEIYNICDKKISTRLILVDSYDNGVAYLYPTKVKKCKVLEVQIFYSEAGRGADGPIFSQLPTLYSGIMKRV
jgi:hypothetical protein